MQSLLASASTIHNITIIAFLLIFVSTAAVALGGLIGKVRIHERYLRVLVGIVIAEVAAVIVLLGYNAVAGIRDPNPSNDAPAYLALLTRDKGWRWDYADQNWVTTGNFKTTPDGKLAFTAETHVKSTRFGALAEHRVFSWESSAPFAAPEAGAKLQFQCKQIVSAEAAKALGPNAPAPGEYLQMVELDLSFAMTDTYTRSDAKDGSFTGRITFGQQ